MPLTVYLDIDGILLTNEYHAAPFANEFLRKVLSDYPDSTYWLTTHCNGDASVPLQHIRHLFVSCRLKRYIKSPIDLD